MNIIKLTHTATFTLTFNKNEVKMLEINTVLNMKGVTLSSKLILIKDEMQKVHYTLQTDNLPKLHKTLGALKELTFQYPSLNFVELT
jgi:hypothetical protein